MKKLVVILASLLAAAPVAASNDHDQACAVADNLVTADFGFPHVAAAIAAKKLTIVVIGSSSSALLDPTGTNRGYPARLEAALAAKLPGVAVKVIAYAKPRETAADMEKHFAQMLAADKPALVVWQTGTVEAMLRSDVDDFRAVLDDGINALQQAQADVVLMNQQYSPRTELMTSSALYADAMRFVALQHQIPLFDRQAVMRHWGELGTFDLNQATKKIDTAVRVHDCIGRLLGRLILDAANLPSSPDHAVQ